MSRLDIGIDNYHTQYSQSFSLDELSNAPDVRNVQATARALSIESRGLLARHKLLQVLSKVQNDNQSCFTSDGGIVHEQAMFLVGKAATQTLGIVLNMLLDQSSLIGSETVYWDDILGSSLYTGHYILQTTPSRIWRLASDIFSNLKTSCARENLTSLKGIAGNWRPFYRIVQRNVQRGLLEHTKKTLSSFSRCRSNIRQKQQYLKVQKNLHASSIGILLDECLTFASNDQASGKSVMSHREWCRGIYKLVLLIETVLRNLSDPLASAKDFEDGIFYAIDNHFQEKQYQSPEESSVDVADLMQRLTSILQYSIPGNIAYNNSTINKHGRPSIFTRYWFPTTVIFMSLTTSLRILTNRKAEIMRWCSELGSTIIDFWGNWVLQPIQKLVGTIRHDEQSEIAIMSRKSLEADWQSLERMVVDFVSDHGSQESGNSQENIKTITMQVREGDLTPVLKAYERDLRKPFIGTVRGDLVRALLIQIQKTKVDVEVAIGGIDALLKSQELVFGLGSPHLRNNIGC